MFAHHVKTGTVHLWIPLLIAVGALFMALTDLAYIEQGGTVRPYLIIAGIMGSVYLFFLTDYREREGFLSWLRQNREAVRNDTRLYRGIAISRETDVVSYEACLSFFVVTATVSSRFFLANQASRMITRLVFSLVTCLFGWWAIPWGPFSTVRALTRNVRGGHRQKVLQLLSAEEMLAEVAR